MKKLLMRKIVENLEKRLGGAELMKKVVYNVFTMSYGEMSNSSLRNEILLEVRDTLKTLMKYIERKWYDR